MHGLSRAAPYPAVCCCCISAARSTRRKPPLHTTALLLLLLLLLLLQQSAAVLVVVVTHLDECLHRAAASLHLSLGALGHLHAHVYTDMRGAGAAAASSSASGAGCCHSTNCKGGSKTSVQGGSCVLLRCSQHTHPAAAGRTLSPKCDQKQIFLLPLALAALELSQWEACSSGPCSKSTTPRNTTHGLAATNRLARRKLLTHDGCSPCRVQSLAPPPAPGY